MKVELKDDNLTVVELSMVERILISNFIKLYKDEFSELLEEAPKTEALIIHPDYVKQVIEQLDKKIEL